ncbi:hypothetical protein G5I_01084 [Acromyrmex echinatior]|uniref:Uncharacterized protein n=1 Tax=Acromyrmex echinatior TaxID=103372 RepID=F4W6J0_ACREC|nr:hypothetical protein G5I_01084 [Acromyrmex echinatior]
MKAEVELPPPSPLPPTTTSTLPSISLLLRVCRAHLAQERKVTRKKHDLDIYRPEKKEGRKEGRNRFFHHPVTFLADLIAVACGSRVTGLVAATGHRWSHVDIRVRSAG